MAQTMIDRIGAMQDFKLYRELHWEGSFEEYLALVRERPQVTRNAYQRLYDLIIELDHNTRPRIARRGSAVFVHIARPDRGPTAGCIAAEPAALLRLLARIGPKTRISVRF